MNDNLYDYLFKLIARTNRYEFKIAFNLIDNPFEKLLYQEDKNKISYYEQEEGREFIDSIRKDYSRYREKKKNLNARIKYMMSLDFNKLYFGTLTFNNDIFKTTTEETRRRYVNRQLKNKCSHYVANIDYGNENEREHYHFIGIIKEEEYKDKKHLTIKWKYGYDDIKKVRDSNDYLKLSSYISKLVNHSFKASTKNKNRIIYSRSFNTVESQIKELEQQIDNNDYEDENIWFYKLLQNAKIEKKIYQKRQKQKKNDI